MRLVALLALCALAAPLARPADTDTVESAVKAIYAAISGPAGPRDWDRFRALFADGASLIAIRTSPQGPAALVMTPGEYVEREGNPIPAEYLP